MDCGINIMPPAKPTIIRFIVFIGDDNVSPGFEKGVKGGVFNFVKETSTL